MVRPVRFVGKKLSAFVVLVGKKEISLFFDCTNKEKNVRIPPTDFRENEPAALTSRKGADFLKRHRTLHSEFSKELADILSLGVPETTLHIFDWRNVHIELVNVMLVEASQHEMRVPVNISPRLFQVAAHELDQSSLDNLI